MQPLNREVSSDRIALLQQIARFLYMSIRCQEQSEGLNQFVRTCFQPGVQILNFDLRSGP